MQKPGDAGTRHGCPFSWMTLAALAYAPGCDCAVHAEAAAERMASDAAPGHAENGIAAAPELKIGHRHGPRAASQETWHLAVGQERGRQRLHRVGGAALAGPLAEPLLLTVHEAAAAVVGWRLGLHEGHTLLADREGPRVALALPKERQLTQVRHPHPAAPGK